MEKICSIIALLVLMLSSASCTGIFDQTCKTATNQRVTVLVDKTDPSTVRTAATYFKHDSAGLCPLLRNLEEAGIYQYASCNANALSLGFISDLGEEPQTMHNHNPLPLEATAFQAKTNKGVVAFRKHFAELFDTSVIGGSSRKTSKIYEPLIAALNEIKNTHKSGSETLILFTDGVENANGISMYGNKGRDTLDLYDKLVERYGPLPDATGIDVVFVAPRNTQNDEVVDKSRRFWTTAFAGLHPKSFSFRSSLVLPVKN